MGKRIAFVVLALSSVFLLRAWDDEQLFTSTSTSQKPFVMVLMDTSASMNQVVYYPKDGINNLAPGTGYDPYKTGGYSGTIYLNSSDLPWSNPESNDHPNAQSFDDDDQYSAMPTRLESGFYGFRVNEGSNFIKAYSYYKYYTNKWNYYLALADDGTSVQVSQTTYNQAAANWWLVGEASGARARVTAKAIVSGKYYLTVDSREATFPGTATAFTANERLHLIPPLQSGDELKCAYIYGYGISSIEGVNPNGEQVQVRYNPDYLNWMLLHATTEQLQSVSNFHKYGTFDTAVAYPDRPVDKPSNCNCSSVNKQLVPVTRIQAGREAMCYIISANMGKAVFGLARFYTDDSGGQIVENLNNVASWNSLAADVYTSYGACGNTPLAMALADVWAYMKPSGGLQGTYWPTGWKNDGTYSTTLTPSTSTSGFVSGGANYCTHFYNIIVTDGESNRDKFGVSKFDNSIFKKYSAKRKQPGDLGYVTPPASWKEEYGFYYLNGWGDYDSHDTNTFYNDGSRTYCKGDTCWLNPTTTGGGSDLLDDVAYLMYHSDMLPDNKYPAWPGDQNVVSHVVGFNVVNDMLKETAANGQGQFFTSSSYEELALALQSALDLILLREENMMYNVFAAPKQAVTAKAELFGFKGTFWPRNNKSFWEGHLRCYTLTTEPLGDFPDEANYEWDAYDKLAATEPAARAIYTYTGSAPALTDASNAFTTALDPTHLGLAAADTSTRDQVVNFIRGDNGYDYKLGDIFHFNPLVVGSPLYWKALFDPSYMTFYDAHKDRKEVVYVGANDGMMHCIEVAPDGEVTEGGNEVWGFIPPSHLTKVKNLALISPLDLLSKVPKNWTDPLPCPWDYDRYFVDGKGIVMDVKYGSPAQWHTVLIFSMGIGGRTVCAMEVSDPEQPQFLWEFTDPYMGYTEARPLIVDIRETAGGVPYPAVVIPGGYDFWELPAETSDPLTWTGKSLYVVKVEPGANNTAQLVKRFIYVRDGTAGDTYDSVSKVYTHRNAGFVHPFTAAPAAFDQNNDGIADYLYACDSGNYRDGQQGGSIWKINVYGDPAYWLPQRIFQANDEQTLYLSPTLGYDETNNLWVFVGSGRRSQITAHTSTTTPTLPPVTTYTFLNNAGQFYAFQDLSFKGSTPTYPLQPSDSTLFKDITPLLKGESTEGAFEAGQIGLFFDYFMQPHEVIFEPTPLFIASTLSINTFAPEQVAGETTDPCIASTQAVGGSHYVYQFTLGNNNGTMGITDTNVMINKILGYGLLTSGEFVIYFGPGKIGTFTVTGKQNPSLINVFGPVIWKERKK